MAQGRMIKKEISNSEKLGQVKTDKARVLYFMMLPHLDVKGRLEANVKRIKGQIVTMLPYTEKTIQTCLEQLHDAGLIILYSVSDKQYLEFTRFGDFQSLNPEREAESNIPQPAPENSRELQRTPPKYKLSLSKDNISKEKHLDFVFLEKAEYEKLIGKYGKSAIDTLIEELNNYLGQSGRKYKSHYYTLLNWARRKKLAVKGKKPTPTKCVFCHTDWPQRYMRSTQGQIIYVCDNCREALKAVKIVKYDRSLGELEKMVEKGKQKLNTNRKAIEKKLQTTGSETMSEYETKEKVREQRNKLAKSMTA